MGDEKKVSYKWKRRKLRDTPRPASKRLFVVCLVIP